MKNTVRCDTCCREETKMVRCAVTALEKMKDMFGAALDSITDSSNQPLTSTTTGCLMDTKCKIRGCPFRATEIAPNALQTFCDRPKTIASKMVNDRLDPNGMRLYPGEVGLRGNRATFHMNQNPEQSVPVNANGRPTGAVYYNMVGNQQIAHKHVMQVLPTLPASSAPSVGPVTGLPIAENETVFVVRLDKPYDEPDEKARLQIEMRVPKQPDMKLVDISTQCSTSHITVNPDNVEKKEKSKKEAKNSNKKAKNKRKK